MVWYDIWYEWYMIKYDMIGMVWYDMRWYGVI